MCFASSIVEAHKKLFIAPTTTTTTAATTIGSEGTVIDPKHTPTTGNTSGGGSNSTSISGNTEKKTATKMSRSKSRLQTEVCGDCGASDPAWASINRGILLCSDCCSVHRSLGRHISVIKSLRQGTWEPSVLNFVNSLNAHGANSVWEHHLLDGTTIAGGKGATRMRKPNPKDALHPNKSDFIKAKHVNLTFVLKPNLQDDDTLSGGGNLEQELSKQLHASVRTSNLETSLRLLVQGADPNFYHEEKRSTPLHVAAKFGQASQIELLIAYGADINAIDGNGLTPLEVAKANNHNVIAERLLDAMYEVTDRIIMFLGGKKPDHATGRHLIIPDANNAEISEQLKIARGRLQLVPNKMFEELVMDLYDEVDRRENEAIWATSTLNAENVAVPFLPANPFLSATRNQGRQKLARFSRAEFAGLLTDVLIDARRRQNMANLRPMDAPANNSNANMGSFYNVPGITAYNTNANNEHDPNLSDDEPIYDPVASDDDYAAVPAIAEQAIVHYSPATHHHQQQQQHPQHPATQTDVENLRKQISVYVSEINQLRNVVQKLSSENSELKSKFSQPNISGGIGGSGGGSGSVYDEPLRIDLNGTEPESEPQTQDVATATSNNSSSASSSATNSNQSTIKRPASMYERRLGGSALGKGAAECRTTTSMYQMAGSGGGDKQTLVTANEVIQRTDLITRRLKELLIAMQDAKGNESLVPSAERLRLAVIELIALFSNPPLHCNETVMETLKQLTRYNALIQRGCENLQKSYDADDKQAVEKYTKEVRDCAYYIASATKSFVLQYK